MLELEKYRKFFVALIASISGIWIVVASADLSTKEGLYSMIAALVTAVGVYAVPNKTTP